MQFQITQGQQTYLTPRDEIALSRPVPQHLFGNAQQRRLSALPRLVWEHIDGALFILSTQEDHDIERRENGAFQVSRRPGGNALIRSAEVFAHPDKRIIRCLAGLVEKSTDRRWRIACVGEHGDLALPPLEN